MARNLQRPLSPHWTIWKWGPHMVVSILNRVTGAGLATVGTALFVWWLAAAATGVEAYDYFMGWMKSPLGLLLGVGLTWAIFLHAFAGIRHFVLDMGAGFELKTNKSWAMAVIVGSFAATALVWALILTGVR